MQLVAGRIYKLAQNYNVSALVWGGQRVPLTELGSGDLVLCVTVEDFHCTFLIPSGRIVMLYCKNGNYTFENSRFECAHR